MTRISRKWLGGCVWGALALGVVLRPAGAQIIRYDVSFQGGVMATQTVTLAAEGGTRTVTTAFSADLPVFIARHHYAEKLSATFRADGTVERLEAIRVDGPIRTEITGELQADGRLRTICAGRDGITTNFIARADYDFHSLILYGTAPGDFLPAGSPARVLSVATGRVVPVTIQTITESETFERQHLVSTHLIWTEGVHVSHSWHPERFSNLPRRYVRQTENGGFTFTLLR